MRVKFLCTESFSLIEIFVVFSLLSLLFILGLPCFSFFDRFLLRAETEKLYTTIVFLQQRSIASGQEQRLILNTTENSYSYNVHSKTITTHFLNKEIVFGFLEGANGPPAEPKKLIRESVTFTKAEDNSKNCMVVFREEGKISSGTIYLRNKRKNYMMAITCPISQVSWVRKYSYDNRWVLER